MSNQCIDKISFTLTVLDSHKVGIRDKLIQLSKTHGLKVRVYSSKKERFNSVYQIFLNNGVNDFCFKILIYPLDPSHNFIKGEFNPNHAGIDGLIMIRNIFIYLLTVEDTRRIYFEAPVTRIDINIDSNSTGIMDHYIYMLGANTSENVLNSQDEIESQIVGSKSSDVRFTVYNKGIELGNELGGDSQHFRLEARIRDIRCPINKLNDDLLKHFNKLRFFDSLFLKDQYFSKEFKFNAKENGINSALHKLDSNTRKNYLRHLNQYVRDPFDLKNIDISNIKKQLRPLRSNNYQKAA